MEFLRKPKLNEMLDAMSNRNKNITVVYGPSGSLKTTVITEIAEYLGLSIEYIEDISKYKNKLLRKNSICLTDIDCIEYFYKHKNLIGSFKNLIIETRTLQFIGKHIKCIQVVFNKVTPSIIKKILRNKLLEKDNTIIDRIDGNLHRLEYYKYSSLLYNINIYHYLGKLFYSKDIVDVKFNKFKITNYLFTNSIYLVDIEDIYKVYEGFSLTDYQLDEFYEFSEYIVFKSKKNEERHFYSFKSSSYEELHVCSDSCKKNLSLKNTYV